MEALFLKLLNLSITAGWITLAILILRPLLKKAPKALTVALWALVAIRLLFPFSIESVISLIPSAETVPPEIVYAEEPAIDSGITYANTIINPVISENLAPAPEERVNPMQILVSVASVIWAVGMIAMAIYATVSYLRIRLKVRASIPMNERIRICDNIPSPFILGILRPRIYLPSELEESQREYVVSHEEAHLKRKDHWWKPLGFALLTVYWFHPLLWVAYILLCRDIEQACDERVIKSMEPQEKAAYSKALLSCSAPRRMISACPLAFGEVGVKKRIKAILHYKKPAFWISVIAVVICIVCTGCLLTDPLKKIEASTENEAEQVMLYDGYVYYKTILQAPTIYSSIPEINLKYRYFTYHLENDQLQFIEDNQIVLAGDMVPIELTKENFDDMCFSTGNTANTLQSIRESNESAWKISVEDEKGMPFVCYFLKQTNQADPILVFFRYDTTIDVIFQITPAKPTGLPNSETLINDFLNGNMDQIERLNFSYYQDSTLIYTLNLGNNHAGTIKHQDIPDDLVGIIPSYAGPYASFDYSWNGETLTATFGDMVLFTLIPSTNGVLYRSGEHEIMPTVSSSYVAKMPLDGSFFVLSSVEYQSN